MEVSGRIEATDLCISDQDFSVTLAIIDVNASECSPWSEFIKLNIYNVKFRIKFFTSCFSLCCIVKAETCDIDDGIQDQLLISAKIGDYYAQRYITSYNIEEDEDEVGMFRIANSKKYQVTASVTVTQSSGSFKSMYDDETLLDFKLAVKGSSEGSEKESVGFHRVVLAMWSPVMKNMFNNSWKEKNEGVLELPLKLEVIKAFKKYVYTEELPEDRETLLGLVELGSYFMDPKLEYGASKRIINLLAPSEIWETLEYSVIKKTNKLSRLLVTKLNNAGKAELDQVLDKI